MKNILAGIFTQENIFKSLFFLCAIISIVAVLTICLFLFSNAIPTLYKIGFKDFILAKNGSPLTWNYSVFFRWFWEHFMWALLL